MTWALPFLKSIEQALANMVENDDVSLEELDELTMILQSLQMNKAKSGKGSTGGQRSNCEIPLDGLRKKSLTESLHFGRRLKLRPFLRSKSMTVFFSKTKIGNLKDRAIELLMRMKSRQGIVIRKEARATKLVATVMMIFLLCYMPFFTLNIVKVFKLMDNSWTEDMEQTFIVFTWFGYVNSCLNPAIYSLFNRKFRIAFKKLLRCQNNPNAMKRKTRKMATGTLIPTSYSPTNDQPTTLNLDAQLKRLTNIVEKKFNKRINLRTGNQRSQPLLSEVVSVHNLHNSNSADKVRENNVCHSNSRYSLDSYKIDAANKEGQTGSIDNDLHFSNRSITTSTNNVSIFDESYIDLANVKIKCFFTEAVEV